MSLVRASLSAAWGSNQFLVTNTPACQIIFHACNFSVKLWFILLSLAVARVTNA
jgi:hypothetical protein